MEAMMNPDADKKRAMLHEWWSSLLPDYSVLLFTKGMFPEKPSALQRLEKMKGSCRVENSVYVLFSESVTQRTPVYIGKAESPLKRWGQHLDQLIRGTGSYMKWRQKLLDESGLVREDLRLLIVPESAILRPPIPGFPIAVGSVEYQLVGLADDAFPGHLLNAEGVGR